MSKNKQLHHVLYERFGYHSFRAGQQPILESLLDGEDVVALIPTGGGKSLCYQLYGYMKEGTILVVSPLLSLMEDQIDQLRAFGEKRVVALNSLRTLEEKQVIVSKLHTFKFIFTSPEMLQSPSFFSVLQTLSISLFVIDEAHCISQWGHEFRPDYRRLQHIRAALQFPLTLALTATATKDTLNDIATTLQLEKPVFHLQTVNRPNIALSVERFGTHQEKLARLVEIIKANRGAGIVYVNRRALAEQLYEYFYGTDGIRPAYYHGGLNATQRILIQQQFIKNELDVLFATSAFGMGINKPDIGWVVHFQPPPYIESYVQEFGRAGRNDEDAIAYLFFCDDDVIGMEALLQREWPTDETIIHFIQFMKRNGHQVTDVIKRYFIEKSIDESHERLLMYLYEKYRHENEQTVITLCLEQKEKRLHLKRKGMQQFLQYICNQHCYRESLLTYFDEELQEKPMQCCNYCGLNEEQYKGKKVSNIEKESKSWEECLKNIFFL